MPAFWEHLVRQPLPKPRRRRKENGNENATAGVAAVIEINFDCELCDFVSRHRYNFKRHLKRMHGKTEIEAEELAKEEGKKKTRGSAKYGFEANLDQRWS